MNRKRFTSVIAVLLAALMLLSLVAGIIPMLVSADYEDELAQLKSQRDELVSQMYAQQDYIEELEASHADVLERKQALDERNSYLAGEIEVIKKEIAVCQSMIAEKEIELNEAVELENAQFDLYRTRVRAMEESGGYNLLSVIFNSQNFADLLSAIDDMTLIMKNDRAIEEAYLAALQNTEKVKAEYEEYNSRLTEEENLMEQECLLLETQIAEADALIVEILSSIDEANEELELIVSEERAAETRVANLIIEIENRKAAEEAASRQQEQLLQQQQQQAAQQQASQQQQQQQQPAQEQPSQEQTNQTQQGSTGSGNESADNNTENSSSTETAPVEQPAATQLVGSGAFCWPVSCTYITSCVGNRYHPISGEWKYHSGMDIGSSYGDSIWASDAGVVTIAEYYGGYGNCVMIDHRNGYYTLYGHMSSIAVYQGQEVPRGTILGYVGSTGVSTGPHLHFEIRSGGACLDFASWFSGLTYDPDSGGDT